MQTIAKTLSSNDTGETGSHQAGICIPRDERILSFFPGLRKTEKNPRAHILFDDDGMKWEFAFIYYNNKFFGGTRNEYRLTRMTEYIRNANLVSGDELIFTNVAGQYSVSYKRKDKVVSNSGVLILSAGWQIVQI